MPDIRTLFVTRIIKVIYDRNLIIAPRNRTYVKSMIPLSRLFLKIRIWYGDCYILTCSVTTTPTKTGGYDVLDPILSD